jgi:hypothetical protein
VYYFKKVPKLDAQTISEINKAIFSIMSKFFKLIKGSKSQIFRKIVPILKRRLAQEPQN